MSHTEGLKKSISDDKWPGRVEKIGVREHCRGNRCWFSKAYLLSYKRPAKIPFCLLGNVDESVVH